MKVTVLTAKKTTKKVNRKTIFTSEEHVAFITRYKISDRNQVEKFPIPKEVIPFLK